MKKRKLKGFVLPTLYLVISLTLFVGIIFLGSDYTLTNKNYDFGTEVLTNDVVESVIKEEVSETSTISLPVDSAKANIQVHFYNSKDSEEIQKNSLIYYENTYMPNTGVLYVGEEEYEVMSVFSGKVLDVLEDDFFGKYVIVEHNDNLKTYYYGLDNIEVEKDDEITTGTVLGISKNNNVMNDKKTFLLEVYYQGKLINPETFLT